MSTEEKPGTLYLIPWMQKEQITRWCLGTCGKGIVGCVECEGVPMQPCRQTECPHLDREMSEPFGEITTYGHDLCYLRKLQEIEPSSEVEKQEVHPMVEALRRKDEPCEP